MTPFILHAIAAVLWAGALVLSGRAGVRMALYCERGPSIHLKKCRLYYSLSFAVAIIAFTLQVLA